MTKLPLFAETVEVVPRWVARVAQLFNESTRTTIIRRTAVLNVIVFRIPYVARRFAALIVSYIFSEGSFANFREFAKKLRLMALEPFKNLQHQV